VGTASTWYADSDGDGFGDPDHSAQHCEQPSGYVDDYSDCDDDDESVYPGADELCHDGVINDCEDSAEEALVECGLAEETDLGDADATLMGEVADDGVGVSISGAGDVDGDGYDDVLVGALGGSSTTGDSLGKAYLV